MQAPRTTLQQLRFGAPDTAKLQPLSAAEREQLRTDSLQLHANAEREHLRSSSTWQNWQRAILRRLKATFCAC